MKKNLVVLLLLAVFLVWACTQEREPVEEDGIRLYFVSMEEQHSGSALGWELCGSSEEPVVPGPGVLLHALLMGPNTQGLTSPFPKGLVLDSWRWDPEHPGNLQVRLSEQYNGLTDISLTLADYCIVLTLSQIPGVETVEIQSGSYAGTYRSHQYLRAKEAELWDDLANAAPPS